MKGNAGKKLHGSEITRAIRDRGMTVTGWAKVHGYAVISVLKIIHGKFGNPGPVGKAILAGLAKDGLLKSNPEGRRVRKSA